MSIPNQASILAVDDTPANLRLLSSILSQHQFKVRPVPNGELALQAAQAAPPDLILLDINMPGMNGYQVCQQLKGNPLTKDIPVIFISALDEVLDKVRAFEVGGVDYVTKPFQFEEVLARVRTHLALRNLQIQLQEANETLEKRVAARTAELAGLVAASGRFVPREFLDHLHKSSLSKVHLGDQVQREMTVMFTDIRNFTSISERMSPQEIFNYLNVYLQCISPVIRKNKGFIDKYLGDGIMALFPDDPGNALQAAVEMRLEVAKLNLELDGQGKEPLRIGIGMNTGSVMLGIIGEQQRLQGTVISDAVNLASRLEGLNKVYETTILACGYTLSRASDPDRFHARFIDRVRVKGKQSTTAVYEVFDGDPGDLFMLKEKTVALFEKGIALYGDKKFSQAGHLFQQVLAHNRRDRAARLYLERSERLSSEGVPPDWTGVETLHQK